MLTTERRPLVDDERGAFVRAVDVGDPTEQEPLAVDVPDELGLRWADDVAADVREADGRVGQVPEPIGQAARVVDLLEGAAALLHRDWVAGGEEANAGDGSDLHLGGDAPMGDG